MTNPFYINEPPIPRDSCMYPVYMNIISGQLYIAEKIETNESMVGVLASLLTREKAFFDSELCKSSSGELESELVGIFNHGYLALESINGTASQRLLVSIDAKNLTHALNGKPKDRSMVPGAFRLQYDYGYVQYKTDDVYYQIDELLKKSLAAMPKRSDGLTLDMHYLVAAYKQNAPIKAIAYLINQQRIGKGIKW